MLKRIGLMGLLLILLTGISRGGPLDDAMFKIGGGGFATSDQVQTGDVAGVLVASVLLPVYWNICLEGDYADLNNMGNWENYTGKVVFFSKPPKTDEPIPYAFFAGGVTHNGNLDSLQVAMDEDKNKFGWDGGLGVQFPLFGAKWYVEGAFKRAYDQNLWMLTAGLVFDLNKPKGEP